MKAQYKVTLKASGSQIDPSFLKRYDKNRDGRSSVFIFAESKKAQEAVKFCEKQSLRYYFSYDFVITMNEIDNDTVFLFGMEETEGLLSGGGVNEEVFGMMDVRQDAGTGDLIISEKAKNIIEANSNGVHFAPVGEYFRLEPGSAGEPLTVLKTLEDDQGIGPVNSDGRYVGSAALMDAVARDGLVSVDTFLVVGESRSVSPAARLINGKLFKALVSYRMRGMRLGNQIWVLDPESIYANE